MRITKRQAAFRHFVYGYITLRLCRATYDQTLQMFNNLGWLEGREKDVLDMYAIPSSMHLRILCLTVSRDIALVRPYAPELGVIASETHRRFGDAVLDVPGFYRKDDGRIGLALPKGCAIFEYVSDDFVGATAGLLCQPLNEKGRYFLLSSRRFGGPKATPLSSKERSVFDASLSLARMTVWDRLQAYFEANARA